MPTEYTVKVYGCQFKCGHKYVRTVEFMEAHEKRCWINPANRTCRTCVHEVYESVEEWYRECKHPDNPQGDEIERRNEEDSGNSYMKPIENCEYWGNHDK